MALSNNHTIPVGADKREHLAPVLLSADEIRHLFETLPRCCPDCAGIMTTASVAWAELRGGGAR